MWNEPAGLGESPLITEADWLGYRNTRQDKREDHRLGQSTPPPVSPPYGMTSEQLATYQRRFTTYARMRITGTGHREYSNGTRQTFEDMSVHRLIDESVDELADLVNYATMLSIALQRLKQRIEDTL